MSYFHLLPSIDPVLWKKAGDHEAKQHGRGKGTGRHHNNATIPAETILAMRRMHEIERKTHQQVQRAFPDLQAEYVRRVLDYELRANLRVR